MLLFTLPAAGGGGGIRGTKAIRVYIQLAEILQFFNLIYNANVDIIITRNYARDFHFKMIIIIIILMTS